MKSTEPFKRVIETHLDKIAALDPLFAETLKKENKTIDGCINYILDTVKKSGINGYTDDEIFNMAIHYYDEDDLKEAPTTKGHVVVNQVVEITDEERQEAKQKALDKVVAEEALRLKTKKVPAKKEVKPEDEIQGSLF